ncbi:MAG: WbuC family cupin fold metalloprotein, partial [Rhodocyclaceae bacterium]
MPDPQPFDQRWLDLLCEQAAAHPRGRTPYLLHASPDDAVQRFFNAMVPASYVMPHRHLTADKDETLVVVRGRLGLLYFDDQGAVTHSQRLSPDAVCAAHIAHGCWHSLVALDPAVFFEVKSGPYVPHGAAERAPWAPAEGSDHTAYLA